VTSEYRLICKKISINNFSKLLVKEDPSAGAAINNPLLVSSVWANRSRESMQSMPFGTISVSKLDRCRPTAIANSRLSLHGNELSVTFVPDLFLLGTIIALVVGQKGRIVHELRKGIATLDFPRVNTDVIRYPSTQRASTDADVNTSMPASL